MKPTDKIFLTVSTVVFGILGLTGILAIAFFKGEENPEDQVIEIKDLMVWGVLPEHLVIPQLEQAEIPGVILDNVVYEQMTLDHFKFRFVEALASGIGPDLVLIPHEYILEQARANRILPIPYEIFPRSVYENLFVDAAKIFLQKEGILAMPLVADPMVVYYNKTMANRELVRSLPTHWDDLISLSRMNTVDRLGIVHRGLIPLGAVDNYRHIKEILSLLLYQAVRHRPEAEVNLYGRKFESVVRLPGAQSALAFYGEFADPNKVVYSWNESLPDARRVFVHGDLFLYPGFVSEFDTVRRLNQNLQFGIAPMLYETGENTQPSTFVRLYGFALPKTSRYSNYLLRAIGQASIYEPNWFEIKGLPPALRAPALPKPDQDSTKKTILDAVFSGIAWYDAAPEETRTIFQDAASDIVLNISTPPAVIAFISKRLTDILK